MKKIIILTLLGICACTMLMAQNNFAVSYAIAQPTGDLNSFIGKTSFRGISFDYRYTVKDNIAIGFSASMNTFYESKPKDTYTVDNISLTGKQYRYSNNIPLLVTGTYFLSPEEPMKPFVTLGLGTMYSRRNTDMNLYTVELEAWNFALQPEIGVQYELSDMTALHLSLKYMQGFQAGNELKSAQSFFSLNIGFAFY
ncbi:outer membrane beta-barrel protein [Chryseolinea serpens]|nr:OmpW family outer membrane protein [Chryseolinea serpens]